MIFKGETTCEKCSHKRVCSMKNELIVAKNELDKLMEKTCNSIKMSIQCDEFTQDITLRTTIDK